MNDDPQPQPTLRQPPAWRGWALFSLALVATLLLGMLAASILKRREEARQHPPLLPIAETETDSAKWGLSYPREYETYLQMSGSFRQTKYGGATQRDYLKQTPANVILFAGYAFAKDYRQARGHVHAIEDVSASPRVGPATPATCWTCKSAEVPRLMQEMGLEQFYAQKFSVLESRVAHPIGCSDCHEPNTMKLRITRPALREAMAKQHRDADQATHQEMRSLVCAQCHVEYYFQKTGNYLAFPWADGTAPEQIEQYYDAADFTDWTHAISKAAMLKMQHPDFEVYRTGVHAYRDVACADCHMPFQTSGGMKFTSHHLQSPLLDIANSCAVCHRWSEEEIRGRVEGIQDKVYQCRQRAENALARAHFDVAAAAQAGADEEQLGPLRKQLRAAQLRWDYVAANNGMGFHSPQECLRILAAAIDLAGQCRVECARVLGKHGVTAPVAYPDFSSKQKAQAVIQQFIDGEPPKLLNPGQP